MLEENIKEIVKEAILEVLSEIEFTKRAAEPEFEVMTTKQLAEYLQCSVPWLIKNLKSLNIPYRKLLDKEYRFIRTEINNWLKERNAQRIQKIKKNNNYKNNEELKIM